jgi:hypothetical protein
VVLRVGLLQGINLGFAVKTRGIETGTRNKTNPTELVSVVIGLLHYLLSEEKMSV